jgi:hypothetical protein
MSRYILVDIFLTYLSGAHGIFNALCRHLVTQCWGTQYRLYIIYAVSMMMIVVVI